MADLLLKVGDVPAALWDDGDIIVAANRRAILCCHAQVICNHRKIDRSFRNQWGLLKVKSPTHRFMMRACEYRFVRQSTYVVERTNLRTGEEVMLGPADFDVRLWLFRRMSNLTPEGFPKKPIFGRPGREIWFDAPTDFRTVTVNRIWDDIETDTPERRVNYRRWPFTDRERRHHLPVAVDEFDEDEAVALTDEIFEETEIQEPEKGDTEPVKQFRSVKKRRNRLRLRDHFSTARLRDVRDRQQAVDEREIRSFLRAQAVRRKNDQGAD